MKIHFVKIGSEDRPATEADIVDMQKQLDDYNDKYGIALNAIVTHHAVSVQTVEVDDDVQKKIKCCQENCKKQCCKPDTSLKDLLEPL